MMCIMEILRNIYPTFWTALANKHLIASGNNASDDESPPTYSPLLVSSDNDNSYVTDISDSPFMSPSPSPSPCL